MKQILIIIAACFCFSSCDQTKSAWDVYKSKPSIPISMPEEEEKQKMNGVYGCYGLTIDETTTKQALSIVKKHNATFEKIYRYNYKVKKDTFTDVSHELSLIPEIKEYFSEIKHSYNSSTHIRMIFLNDTLSQIFLSIPHSEYDLKTSIIDKYGTGNGEKKEGEFGINKDGSLNFNDFQSGYEYRRWQNERIIIDWPDDRYLYKLSNEHLYWKPLSPLSNENIFYTSKKSAPLIISLFRQVYDEYIKEEEAKKKAITNNI